MGAVIDFDPNRRRRVVADRPKPSMLRAIVHSATAQSVMDQHGTRPWPEVEEAIKTAHQALDAGATIMEALAAADECISRHQPAWKREQRNCAFFALAARQIRDRLRGRPHINYHRAMVRARRIIEGGGTIGLALYHALETGA